MKIKLRDFLRDPKRYITSCESGAKYEIEEVGGQVRCCLSGIEGAGFAKRFQAEWGEVYEKVMDRGETLQSPLTVTSGDLVLDKKTREIFIKPRYDFENKDCMGCAKYEAKWVKWEDSNELKLCEACVMKKWPSPKQRKMAGLQIIK